MVLPHPHPREPLLLLQCLLRGTLRITIRPTGVLVIVGALALHFLLRCMSCLFGAGCTPERANWEFALAGIWSLHHVPTISQKLQQQLPGGGQVTLQVLQELSAT